MNEITGQSSEAITDCAAGRHRIECTSLMEGIREKMGLEMAQIVASWVNLPKYCGWGVQQNTVVSLRRGGVMKGE